MRPTIVVSPHLDDAALSCGGGIVRLTRAGSSVSVVTVFTADQPVGMPLSPLAVRSHASWGVGDQPFSVRRAENLTALRLLGAHGADLGFLDAIYRRSPSGAPLYENPLSAPAADDVERLLPQLAAALKLSGFSAETDARVFCPAGTGGHVDHRLTRAAIEELVAPQDIVYYDEYPYSARAGVSSAEGGDAEAGPVSAVPLSAEELDVRIAAISCYSSQLRGLFPSEYERLREILSARLPIVGRRLAKPPDVEASRARMAERVRRDTAILGGEQYRWPARRESPFGGTQPAEGPHKDV